MEKNVGVVYEAIGGHYVGKAWCTVSAPNHLFHLCASFSLSFHSVETVMCQVHRISIASSTSLDMKRGARMPMKNNAPPSFAQSGLPYT